MEMKVYEVRRVCNIIGYNDTFYVLATTKEEAIKKAFPYDKYGNEWWVKYCRYYAYECD